MKFALLTADPSHGVRFWINPETGDGTAFTNWLHVMQGFHFSYDKIKEEGYTFLKDFDVVMMSGHPGHVVLLTEIAHFLKGTNAVSMYYPEGSLQLYDNSINGFHKEYYEAWNACDIISSAEEDKLSYYESFLRQGSKTLVRFIHVPMREEMERGMFFVPLAHKRKHSTLVYGDNNPNHPLVALACANKLSLRVDGVDIDRGKKEAIQALFPGLQIASYPKLALYPFLRLLGRTHVNFYPTEWIGTARQQIACAVAGTPCIGNHDSHTQRRLFPDLGCDIYDVQKMIELAHKLMSDTSFYEYVQNYAFKAAAFYGLEATKARFFDAVEGARKIKFNLLEAKA